MCLVTCKNSDLLIKCTLLTDFKGNFLNADHHYAHILFYDVGRLDKNEAFMCWEGRGRTCIVIACKQGESAPPPPQSTGGNVFTVKQFYTKVNDTFYGASVTATVYSFLKLTSYISA